MLQRPTPPGLLQQDQSHLIGTLIASAQPAVFTTPSAYRQSRKLSPTNTTDSEPSPETTSHKPQRPDFLTRDFAPLHTSTSNLLTLRTGTPLCIRTIVAWYPLLDWTMSRSQKKRESRNPKKCLPKVFTDLFDFSYLPPPDTEGAHCSPYASPGLAPRHIPPKRPSPRPTNMAL